MSRGALIGTFVLFAVVSAILFLTLFAGVYVWGEKSAGTVVDIEYSTSSSRTCFPVVEYEAGGATQRRQTQVGTAPCPFEIGDQVDVYYEKNLPRVPALFSFGALAPLLIPVLLLVGAARVALRRPKASERVAQATEVQLADAPPDTTVKVRGMLEADAALAAPLTERPCVAYWVRVVRRKGDGMITQVSDERVETTGLRLRTAGGVARIAPDGGAVKVLHDASAAGQLTGAPEPNVVTRIEAAGGLEEGYVYGWYEGLYASGDEVFVLGHVREVDGRDVLVAPPGEALVVVAADREPRQQQAQALALTR